MNEDKTRTETVLLFCYQEWDDDKVTHVKNEINKLIWMHSPDSLTLKEADERACEILNLFRQMPK